MLELYLDFQGFINIAQTQHMAESWGNFVRVAEYRQIFLRPDMSSYAAENSNHIQPQVVLLCEHNIIMRILNKIQLIVEFRVSFMQVTIHRQFFTTWYIFITVRKRWGGINHRLYYTTNTIHD